MPWNILIIPTLLPAFALVLFRVGGMLIAVPILSSDAVPMRVRALFAAAMALVVFPILLPTVPAELTLRAALVGGVGEVMIGLLMGLALTALFSGAQLAGMIIGQQAGLGLGQTYNPLTATSTTTIGQIYFIVLLMIFIAAGGLQALVGGLLDSFRAVPLLSFTVQGGHLALLVDLLHASFVLGLKLAGPVMIAMFMTTMTMGILSKTMPQLNILSVGFIVRILVCLSAAALSLSSARSVLVNACYDALDAVRGALGLF
jgi:flagellar biosynthetic protein FliR